MTKITEEVITLEDGSQMTVLTGTVTTRHGDVRVIVEPNALTRFIIGLTARMPAPRLAEAPALGAAEGPALSVAEGPANISVP